MRQVRVLIVPSSATEQIRIESVTPNRATFTSLVADVNTDTVFFTDVNGIAVVAANGKALPTHEPNPRATQIVERFLPGFAKRDRLEGLTVFAGLDGITEEFTDVPAEVVEFTTRLFGSVQGA